MNPSELDDWDDYRWLVGPGAEPWLREAGQWQDGPLALATHLRKALTATRARLVQEQASLRLRARHKFARTEQMFFTSVGLEQATDEMVASYKAGRFPADLRVADLCCGIGGDLLGLARRGPVLGVDRDPVTAWFAEANCRGLNAEVATCDAMEFLEAPGASRLLRAGGVLPLEDCAVVHLDPDRRPGGRRSTQPLWHEPNLEQIEKLRELVPAMALKLAPATDPPHQWRESAEWEWISRGGQCRQLVAWFGGLSNSPGLKRATILGESGVRLRTLLEAEHAAPPIASRIGQYLYEPDAAILAAGLQNQLAAEHALEAISAGIAYFTSEMLVSDPALAGFRIEEQLPLDLKRLRGLLRERGIGRLEVKKRGVSIDPAELRENLGLRGDREATLIVTRWHGQTTALACQRIARTAEPAG